jgi:hypothetical protein
MARSAATTWHWCRRPQPPRPRAGNANADIRRDYELAERVGTREAWDSFVAANPSGFYTDLAKAQRNKLAAENARIAATDKARGAAEEQARLAAEGAKASEQAKAASQMKAAEEARLAAEKKKQLEDEKLAAAERARAAAQAKAAENERLAGEKARLAAEKKKQTEDAKLALAEREKAAAQAKAAEQEKQAAEKAGKLEDDCFRGAGQKGRDAEGRKTRGSGRGIAGSCGRCEIRSPADAGPSAAAASRIAPSRLQERRYRQRVERVRAPGAVVVQRQCQDQIRREARQPGCARCGSRQGGPGVPAREAPGADPESGAAARAQAGLGRRSSRRQVLCL